MLGLNPSGLLLQNGLAHTRGVARLSSGLAVGGATGGNHKSGAKLATGETKQAIW